MKLRNLFIGTAFAAVLSSQLVHDASAQNSWRDQPYPYVVVDANLRQVLSDFGRNLGLTVRLAEDVDGEIRGDISEGSAGEFLDRLARDHDLVWYYDGALIDIANRSSLRTVVLDSTGVSFGRLQSELKELGIFDERFVMRSSDRTSLIYLSGPQRYLELVDQTLNRMRDIASRPVVVVRGTASSVSNNLSLSNERQGVDQ